MSQLISRRIPATVKEAREMVAYNERILATSQSPQRLHRATRMLINVRPHLERLEREEAARLARAEVSALPARDYEVVWSGAQKRVSLIGERDSRDPAAVVAGRRHFTGR